VPKFLYIGTPTTVMPPAAKYRTSATNVKALAAYVSYESMMYMYALKKMEIMPKPIRTEAMIGLQMEIEEKSVQPIQKRPMGIVGAPYIAKRRRDSRCMSNP